MARAGDLSPLQHIWRGSIAASQSVMKPPAEQVCKILLGSWVNVLLLCVPVGLALNYTSGPALAIFIVNFLAAVGLLGLGDSALDCITSQVGTLYGLLLYISTSNLMQMISSIVLLVQRNVVLLQISLVGSLLANILLLPGLSILYAVFHRKDMTHYYYTTKTYTVLLSLALGGIIIPTVFDLESGLPTSQTAAMSRAVSVLLMGTYGAYLYFQLSTHRGQFDRFIRERNGQADEPPITSVWAASAIFVVATVLLYLCVDFMVSSLQEMARSSRFFTGFILIPILNCDVAAVVQAGRSMDLMLMSTLGKCIQSALLVAPFLVVISWGMGFDGLHLSFEIWQVIILFFSVYFVNTLVARGLFHL